MTGHKCILRWKICGRLRTLDLLLFLRLMHSHTHTAQHSQLQLIRCVYKTNSFTRKSRVDNEKHARGLTILTLSIFFVCYFQPKIPKIEIRAAEIDSTDVPTKDTRVKAARVDQTRSFESKRFVFFRKEDTKCGTHAAYAQ